MVRGQALANDDSARCQFNTVTGRKYLSSLRGQVNPVQPSPPHRRQNKRNPRSERFQICSGIPRVPRQSEQISPPSGIAGRDSINSGKPTTSAQRTIMEANWLGSSTTHGNFPSPKFPSHTRPSSPRYAACPIPLISRMTSSSTKRSSTACGRPDFYSASCSERTRRRCSRCRSVRGNRKQRTSQAQVAFGAIIARKGSKKSPKTSNQRLLRRRRVRAARRSCDRPNNRTDTSKQDGNPLPVGRFAKKDVRNHRTQPRSE